MNACHPQGHTQVRESENYLHQLLIRSLPPPTTYTFVKNPQYRITTMQLPYFQILALTFSHLLITTHAMPLSGTSATLEARGHTPGGMEAGLAANVPAQVKSKVPNVQARGLPVNIMQNTDESHPTLPIAAYKADVDRLTMGEQ
ncbi:hypothetical protein BC628DRAFT_1385058 [Trametes gibbosa]|nr:hypothetical protein BC628DRAFT_1385058 [Trametes gibbosa]